LSGGGSGHEPAHAGYIGDGMLAGAILGKVFASPSVNAILAGIRTCAGPHGLLLVIKNYTGDRLNFGMAAERAKSEGFNVEMVVVDDDVALAEGKGITGGRGVAGTVFVHKVAGCAAMNGASLKQVRDIAANVASKVKTLGAALTVCTVPGTKPTNRLNETNIEMAIGIHGEPGQVEDTSSRTTSLSSYISTSILNRILGSIDTAVDTTDGAADGAAGGATSTVSPYYPPRSVVKRGDQVAVLINNLGGTSELEMLVFTKDVMNNLLERGIKPMRCYVGSFMTSLEMTGVSVSLLPLEDWTWLSSLDTPTNASGWKRSTLHGEARSLLKSDGNRRVIPYKSDDNSLHVTTTGGGSCVNSNTLIKSICERIIEIEPLLTEFDSKCGDGDCGLTMKSAAVHILALASKNEFKQDDCAMCCSQLAHAVSESMGGTSGAILEIMLRAMASYFHGKSPSTEQTSTVVSTICTHCVY
jgi:triose/dihydroxyacetone kinase / FAD-AMP lyase (cyclizing)